MAPFHFGRKSNQTLPAAQNSGAKHPEIITGITSMEIDSRAFSRRQLAAQDQRHLPIPLAVAPEKKDGKNLSIRRQVSGRMQPDSRSSDRDHKETIPIIRLWFYWIFRLFHALATFEFDPNLKSNFRKLAQQMNIQINFRKISGAPNFENSLNCCLNWKNKA